MRIHEIVALNVRASSVNTPGEYVIAVVDEDGHLEQRSGVDKDVSWQLLALLDDMDRPAEAQ